MKVTVLIGCLLTASAAWADVPFRLGVAGFSFRKKTLDESLAIMQRADVHCLCVKDFHLRYDADDATISAFREKCAKAGVEPYALGPLYTETAEAVRAYFAFAKRMGVKLIVGVPYEQGDAADSWSARRGSREQLKEIERLVREYDIRYAIHNHGPSAPQQYPDVAYGWNLVKDLDPRIGFCLDVGWEFACGNDPVETIRRYADRIYDVHIKNFEIGKPDGAAVPLPRGKLDYVKIFTALAEVGYAGVCALEYEKDFEDNLAPIAESIGYARGVADAIRVAPRMMPTPAGANALTDAERKAGWTLLWDGRTSAGWVSAKDTSAFPAKGWVMADGTLTMRPKSGIAPDRTWFPLPPEDQKLGGGGDIVTVRKFRDFEFSFDFRLTRAANSGVKYYFDETQNGGTCEEYQILEDGHPDSDKGRDGNRRCASLYDVFPAHAEKALKPTGHWNTGRIVARGAQVEHWLNGVKVLAYERGGAAFRAAVAKSKYAAWGKTADGRPQPWGEIPEGRLLLQDHGDSTVSFCNLKVRELR